MAAGDGCDVGDHMPIEEMELFVRFEQVADQVWDIVGKWKDLPAGTVGKQLVRAVDSIGANLVEGDGRFTIADSLNFFIIARASSREARLWIRRSVRRRLLSPEDGDLLIGSLESSTRQLNQLIRYRRSTKYVTKVREQHSAYVTEKDDPFVVPMYF